VGIALVLGAALLWSTGGVGIKSVEGAPLAIAGWRGAFALPVLAAVALARVRAAGASSAAEALRTRWMWAGAASYALMSVAFVVATKLTTAANAIFIQYTSPAYVALASWPLLRERVTWRDAVACAAVLAGMLLFFGEALSGAARAGNLVAIASSFGAAGLPLALRAQQRTLLARGAHAAAAAAPAITMALGASASLLFCVPAMAAAPPHGASWGILAALGVGQIALPYVLYASAIRSLTALEGSLLPTIEPILNPIWVVLATGERPGALATAGGAVVLLGMTVQAAGRRATA
jgi:drug/metabolite transporter (DMT)-like permease